MIADDFNINNQVTGNYSLPKNKFIDLIIISIKNTHQSFINALDTLENIPLNEDELTQTFVKQNFIQLQYLGLTSIYVGVQYRDIHHKTRGIPDIHYSFAEQGKEYKPSFIMEAKRLPAPSLDRETEYVFGTTSSGNPNGGIERFKLSKHGFGLKECGVLGYVENESFEYWYTQINNWITELSNDSQNDWNSNEILYLQESNILSSYYLSNTERHSDSLKLHHFWVNIKPNSN